VFDEASGITGQTLFVDGGWSKDALPEDLDLA
jgi:enoyl-[acyl-carrier-protein] reductase (NADH)